MSVISGRPTAELVLDPRESELLIDALRWFVNHSERWPDGYTDSFDTMLRFIEKGAAPTQAA